MTEQKYLGLLTDLDNCLYEYEPCNDKAREIVVETLAQRLDKPKNLVRSVMLAHQQEVKKATGYTAASHSRLLYFQKTIEALTGSTNIPLTLEMHTIFWSTYLPHIKLFDGVVDFFDHLRSRKIKIAVVTDMLAEIQMRKLRYTRLDKYIDFLITSEEAGHEKPHPDIFSLALRKLKLKPEQVIMIGDEQEKDIEGARKLGMDAVLVTPQSFKNGSLKEYFP